MATATPSCDPPRLLTGWYWLIALLVLSRPLGSPDLWWDLARGREVAAGAVWPGQTLLVLDHASEASWLGGVPFYGLWSVGGVFALAAVPIVCGLLLVSAIRRRSNAAWSVSVAVVSFLALLAIRADLEPTSWLFDLVGLAAVWGALRRKGDSPSLPILLGAIFVAWANLGPRPLWGLMLVALWPGTVAWRGRALLTSILAGAATPRGPLTWLDSTVLSAPAAFVPTSQLLEARWMPAWSTGPSLPLAAAGLLWMIAAAETWRSSGNRRSPAAWVMLLVPIVAVTLAGHNLALASLWTALWWTSLRGQTPLEHNAAPSRWLRPVLVAITALAVADAGGALVPGSEPIGWGLSQSIDPRLLPLDELIPGQEPVNAWCGDSRSAGVVAWVSRKAKLVDHPMRAILGGRTRSHAELRRDLLTAHQWRYRKDDGAWGGWAFTLREWKASMLCVAAEDEALHRALIETPWKVLKLDSPTVPYVSAETPRFDQAIVNVMRQQAFVETGAWQPSIDIYDPQGGRLEPATLIGLPPSSAPAIRQSRFFRAIQLPMAAVRSLAPLRAGGGTSPVRGEFLRCQEALARDEWVSTGRVSRFRRAVIESAWSAKPEERAPWLDEENSSALSDDWRRGVRLYLEGRPAEAAAAITGHATEDDYARGLLWAESGEIGSARESFLAAVQTGDGADKLVAELWLERIAPAGND